MQCLEELLHTLFAADWYMELDEQLAYADERDAIGTEGWIEEGERIDDGTGSLRCRIDEITHIWREAMEERFLERGEDAFHITSLRPRDERCSIIVFE